MTDKTALEEVLRDHVPREVFFGYPVDPDQEDVSPDYQETCLCGDPFPCAPARLAESFQSQVEFKEKYRTAAMDLFDILDEARAIATDIRRSHPRGVELWDLLSKETR